MPQYTEDDLNLALNNVINGKSLRQVTKDWGVLFSTLKDRINGIENHSKAAESQQRLSKSQEDHLADWAFAQEVLGVFLTYAQIKEFAQRVLTLKRDNKPLGKHWV